MMIDVIIPLYNAHKTIEKTLMSIVFQTVSDDINIILVDDYSDVGYENIIDKYKDLISIKYIKNDMNMGAGYSRQVGIDNSNSKYILFIDSDDLLYTFDTVEKMVNIMDEGFEYLDSYSINEETNSKYINDGDLHGKMYLREFLLKHNIKFNNSRCHEDNAFNNIVLIYDPKRIKYNAITYIYCYNKDSLTKKDKTIEFDRMKIYIENMKYVLEQTKNCSALLINNYLINKYKYLSSYSKNLNANQKIILNNWLLEYDFDTIK